MTAGSPLCLGKPAMPCRLTIINISDVARACAESTEVVAVAAGDAREKSRQCRTYSPLPRLWSLPMAATVIRMLNSTL